MSPGSQLIFVCREVGNRDGKQKTIKYLCETNGTAVRHLCNKWSSQRQMVKRILGALDFAAAGKQIVAWTALTLTDQCNSRGDNIDRSDVKQCCELLLCEKHGFPQAKLGCVCA
jgi:hypothetical protein